MVISRVSSLLGSPTSASNQSNWWNRGGVAVYSKKHAVSLKRVKIGPRLLLMTNGKLHTRFRLVPKSTTLDDLK